MSRAPKSSRIRLEVIDRGLATERQVLNRSLELPAYESAARPSFFIRIQIFSVKLCQARFVNPSRTSSPECCKAKGREARRAPSGSWSEDLIFAIRRDSRTMCEAGRTGMGGVHLAGLQLL
jgi:hypothetical protein